MYEELPMMFYASWYKEDVAPHLSKKQKEKLLKQISKISLQVPIHTTGVEFPKKEFPELAPYSHMEKISGLQLYAVMVELFNELHKGSGIPRPYPVLPIKKLRKVV